MNTKFYGLTGGIGSGKSTVANIFHQLGAPTLDLDKVGHRILRENNEVIAQLTTIFGQGIINNQRIDTSKLAAKAFQSAANTQALNNIMHPAIHNYEQQWRHQQNTAFAIIEASVLIESDGIKRMDALIVILAKLHLRQQRVLARGKQDKVALENIMNQQCNDKTRLDLANFVIYNNHGLTQLKTEVEALYLKLSNI